MNILTTITYQPIEDFTIQIGEIDGWMDIVIGTKDKSHSYMVSYICDPLNDLLNATVLLLTNQPCYLRATWFIKDTAIIMHDLEEEVLVWYMHFADEKLRILIWDNVEPTVVEEWCYCDFDPEEYSKSSLGLEEMPDVNNRLLIAIEGKADQFASTLLAMFDKVQADNPGEEYRDHWGVKYSEDNYRKLSEWLASRHPSC